jgi:hypothetical protein
MDLKAVESALALDVVASRAGSEADPASAAGPRAARQWAPADVTVDGQGVRVERSVTASGRAMFRYWVGERRVDRAALLHLTCPEQACPRRRETLQRWRGAVAEAPTFRPGNGIPPVMAVVHAVAPVSSWAARRSSRLTPQNPATPRAQTVDDLPVVHEGRAAVARPAHLVRPLRCPNDVHGEINVTVQAWDLFTPEGRFIATVDSLLKEVATLPTRDLSPTPG